MSWLKGTWRLLRLPLFVTAVADVAAAYLIAALWTPVPLQAHLLLPLAGVSTGLYLFGMIENDLVDIRRDRALGVRRPLVTGEVGLPTAVVLMIATLVLVAGCAVPLRTETLMPIAATFILVNLYNLGAKHGPAHVAMPVMGLCRVANYGIGVVAAIGVPHGIFHLELLGPLGPIWFRHAIALFFATSMITGYSIAARRGDTVSARPWQAAFLFVFLAAVGLWFTFRVVGKGLMLQLFFGPGTVGAPPVARTFALLLLPTLWPGGLWSVMGTARRPAEYGRFIERVIYWLILLDAAFVFDTAWRVL